MWTVLVTVRIHSRSSSVHWGAHRSRCRIGETPAKCGRRVRLNFSFRSHPQLAATYGALRKAGERDGVAEPPYGEVLLVLRGSVPVRAADFDGRVAIHDGAQRLQLLAREARVGETKVDGGAAQEVVVLLALGKIADPPGAEVGAARREGDVVGAARQLRKEAVRVGIKHERLRDHADGDETARGCGKGSEGADGGALVRSPGVRRGVALNRERRRRKGVEVEARLVTHSQQRLADGVGRARIGGAGGHDTLLSGPAGWRPDAIGSCLCRRRHRRRAIQRVARPACPPPYHPPAHPPPLPFSLLAFACL